MTERDQDRLTPAQRDALAAWAEMSVPDGFADRVLDVMDGIDVGPDDDVAFAASRPATPTVARWRRRHTIMTITAAAAALLLVLDLGGRRDSADAGATTSEARRALLAHCAPCHESGATGADTAALGAFDLDDADWWTRLSSDQLAGMLERASDLPDDDRDAVARFVAARRG